MTSVAEVAKEAFDGVGAEFSDVILDAVITRRVQGAYDAASGAYTETSLAISGRAIVSTESSISDYFPDYVIGPGDELIFLEGLSSRPIEADILSIPSHPDRTIRSVGDIVGVGSFFAVVAR